MNSHHPKRAVAAAFISLALISLLSPLYIYAQEQRRGQRGKGRASTAPSTQQDERRAARRARAINLLIETADRARAFNDLLYRARIQALAADALWAFDEARARQIFRRAWEAAAASDRAEERAAEEESGIFSNSDETAWTAVRDEVLSKAAARDE